MNRRFFEKRWKSCTTKKVQGLLSEDEVARWIREATYKEKSSSGSYKRKYEKLQNNVKKRWRIWCGRNPLTFAWFAMLTKHTNNCKFRTGPLEKLEKTQVISFEAASEPAARKLSLIMPKRWEQQQEMLRKKYWKQQVVEM